MANSISILLVEDEQSLGSIIAENLGAAGFQVTHVMSGEQALELLKKNEFTLLIFDVMMPGIDGFELARTVRQSDQTVPIIFLTSKTMPQDVVEGFESGGNDYLRKPFAMQELVIRIKVLVSEGRLLKKDTTPAKVSIGQYQFDSVKQQLIFNLRVQTLTAREAELLWLLYKNHQQLSSKKTILEAIWGDDNFFNSRTLDVFITKLRKLLQEDPGVQIINVRGMGYKLVW
ncbi:response regulator transcription factor [Terrimonas sp. NA20]|uniref:Response regulator transcription factor n=1 Tax=Terrimonas ginsenosidimutans TaxID=2908004 RepID=A0ABS9KTY2_9BACT|nr:response regulator transcription factor [Terrimonas ginsenosidimutans]MCG2615752.1 response regulator transcription factor [Terrimonas ginsenosidimutans]